MAFENWNKWLSIKNKRRDRIQETKNKRVRTNINKNFELFLATNYLAAAEQRMPIESPC